MRNMRLKGHISEYVDGKDKIRIRDLLYHLNEEEGVRKVTANLNAMGWRQENRKDDTYIRR